MIYEGTERQTIANGRNLGGRAAKGDYLVFMDSDTVLPDPDEFFQKAVQVFKDNKELLGLTCSIKVWKEAETLPWT